MAWYPLLRTGGTPSAGDEFFENQCAGWSLWSFSASDDDQATSGGTYRAKQEHGDYAAFAASGPSSEEEQPEGPAPFQEPPLFAQLAEDMFLSQFSDEEIMRSMDDPLDLEALGMFPDSMNRLLSYESMLTGVLAGPEEGDARLVGHDHNGVDDTVDARRGFPRFSFSHEWDDGLRNAEQSDPETPLAAAGPSSQEDKAGLTSVTKRSRPVVTDAESSPGCEALVLEELEDVVFQLTKRTRMCYRDAFYRLAESSNAANRSTSMQSFHQQPDGSASGFYTPSPGCPERETNRIDRTVMVLTMKPPRQLVVHGDCCADDDDSGAEAQSTTSWTTRAGGVAG